jgi:hypothetical protein
MYLQSPLNQQVLDAQRFFQNAGFKINTTNETASFLTIPLDPMWQRRIKSGIYTYISRGKPLDGGQVIQIHHAVIIPISLQSTRCIKLQESAPSHAQKSKSKRRAF